VSNMPRSGFRVRGRVTQQLNVASGRCGVSSK
jgi:hypothetical protein